MKHVSALSEEEINDLLPQKWHAGAKHYRSRGIPFWVQIEVMSKKGEGFHSRAGLNCELILIGFGVFVTIWRGA